MKQPQVTVIIPTHNRRTYLQACLGAVARQTYQRLQVIVVDDASTEDIGASVAAVTWPVAMEVLLIRLAENGGPGGSREAGRQRASGAFIAYLDSDDLWHERFIETMLATLQTQADCSMAYCQSLSYRTLPITGQETLRNGYPVDQILPSLLLKRPWTTSACLWSYAATQQIGPWYAGFAGEDLEYEFRAGCHRLKVVYVSQPLCYVADGHHERLTQQSNKIIYRTMAFLQKVQVLETFGGFADPILRQVMVAKLWRHFLSLVQQPFAPPALRAAVIEAILKHVKRPSCTFLVFTLLRLLRDIPLPSFVVRRLMRVLRVAPEWQTEAQLKAICEEKFLHEKQVLVRRQQEGTFNRKCEPSYGTNFPK